jgi:hypothetical protein
MPKKMNKAEALEHLNRQSGKYAEALNQAEDELEVDEALVFEEYKGEPITNTEVAGMRQYFDRHKPGKYKLRSKQKADGEDEYLLAVFRIE